MIRTSKEKEYVAYNLANYNVILESNNSDYIGRDEELPENDYIKAGDGADYVVGPEQYRLIRRQLHSRDRGQYPIARMNPAGLP